MPKDFIVAFRQTGSTKRFYELFIHDEYKLLPTGDAAASAQKYYDSLQGSSNVTEAVLAEITLSNIVVPIKSSI